MHGKKVFSLKIKFGDYEGRTGSRCSLSPRFSQMEYPGSTALFRLLGFPMACHTICGSRIRNKAKKSYGDGLAQASHLIPPKVK